MISILTLFCSSYQIEKMRWAGHVARMGESRRLYRGTDKSLARWGRKRATATEAFDVHITFYFIIIGGILVLFIY